MRVCARMVFIPLVFSVFLGLGSSQVPPGCEVTTTTGYRYSNFHHLHTGSDGTMEVRFRVMAKSDAHIALTTSPLVLSPLYEIVIGASGNNYTDLRRTMTGRSVSAIKTPNVLSDSEFRGFWIAVRQGEVEVGKEGETLPYFHWKDNDPLPVHYYSLSSWTNTVAKWIQKCNFTGPSSWLATNDSPDDTPAPAVANENFFSLEDKLRMNLLQTYNKDTRPMSYHQVPVELSLSLSLMHFEVMASRIEAQVWLEMAWRDPRLQWNITDYDNITFVRIPNHAIWQPDLSLLNNANAGDSIHFGDTNAMVFPDGLVWHAPPATLTALCDLDLRYWPYDIQTCEFKFLCWAHYGNEVNVTVNGQLPNNGSTHLTLSNHEWKVIDFAARDELEISEDEILPRAVFTLTIQRNSPIHRATAIVPVIVVVLLTIASFILPPNSSERIYIGLVNSLIVILYLIYLSAMLPHLGDRMPLLLYFYSYTLVTIGLSMVMSMISLAVNRMPLRCGPPCWVMDIVLSRVGYILGLHIFLPSGTERLADEEQRTSTYTLHTDDSHHVALPDNRKLLSRRQEHVQMEWLLVTTGIDRIILLVLTITFAIMMAAFL